MKKIIISTAFTFLSLSFNSFSNDEIIKNPKKLYKEMHLENKLDYKVFENALTGYNRIKGKKTSLLTIIDYTKPSTEERFYVLNLQNKNVMFNTHVTHGKNSGKVMAVNFSNTLNSYKSSLGFFITDSEAYTGSNGYSLRLKGLEPGINSNAFSRNIVVHGADYAKPDFIKGLGFLGRSLGCPAIPTEISKDVIDTIKNGTVLFIAGDDDKYFRKSRIVGS
ncbi:MAG: murein L,D-transpeptidase catalytic domain family protein [Cetobacterium sp.]|uniref:murein L,D-transpeptidase catalytic domain family protein n=1 Tax=Cetobacterium sp. TaxID=2071632 RepID=UPI002FC9FCA0